MSVAATERASFSVMRYVTESEVAHVLTPAEAFDAVLGSLRRLAAGQVESRPRERLALPDGVFAVMPCVDRGLGYAGLKTYVWTPERASFLIVLFTVSGEPVAVIEAAGLGELRTAAASAVAATHLASETATTLGVFGCGRQAASHVRAMRRALPSLDRVVVQARDRDRLAAFCHVHDAEPATSDEVAACDVVVTATTARAPVLAGSLLPAGAFVCAVGANDPEHRELDDAVFERATLVCTDSVAEARAEAGDLIAAVDGGLLAWGDVYELHGVVTRTPPLRNPATTSRSSSRTGTRRGTSPPPRACSSCSRRPTL